MGEGQANLRSFLQWAAELGISDSPSSISQLQSPKNRRSCLGHSLSVSHFPDTGGRGLAAARDLRKGELILRVPKSALITTGSLMKGDDGLSVLLQKHSYLSPTQMLTVALLNEVGKQARSFWYPYLLQLPRSYETLATFSPFEIKAMQVDDAIWAAEKSVGKVELDWKNCTALMEELQLKLLLTSFKAWRWASAAISSRTMHVAWDLAGCLCPVGDFFNYAAPGEEQILSEYFRNEDSKVEGDSEQLNSDLIRLLDGVYDEDEGAYCFYARKFYKKGEQALL